MLAILRFYSYGANASEAGGKIAMDEKIIVNAPCGLWVIVFTAASVTVEEVVSIRTHPA